MESLRLRLCQCQNKTTEAQTNVLSNLVVIQRLFEAWRCVCSVILGVEDSRPEANVGASGAADEEARVPSLAPARVDHTAVLSCNKHLAWHARVGQSLFRRCTEGVRDDQRVGSLGRRRSPGEVCRAAHLRAVRRRRQGACREDF